MKTEEYYVSHQDRIIRVDRCMGNTLELINNNTEFRTLGCCSGHGKYHPTIIVVDKRGYVQEWFTGVNVFRKICFYKRDDDGQFYIPEVEIFWKERC
jgi:hypothetical protein